MVKIIGAGLAGSEAAWYLANKGLKVKLYEMRPVRMTPAHVTALASGRREQSKFFWDHIRAPAKD